MKTAIRTFNLFYFFLLILTTVIYFQSYFAEKRN